VTITAVPLSITASSTTANYGVAVPAITPIYNGFVNGDMPGSVGTGATVRATPKRWTVKTRAAPE